MSELYFRLGDTEGFTSKKLADKKIGYANPIRELLQNSLDTSKEAGNQKCEINIYIETIKKSAIPHITDYEKYLKQAIKFQKSVGSYNHNSAQIVNSIQQELKQDELDILMFVDNGKGISPDILDGLIGERSVKSDESSGGSFGVGHLSPYFLSSLRYVLYASKYQENDEIKQLFSGVPILAGFEDENATRGATGRILQNIPKNESKPKFIFPTTYPDFIVNKMNNVNTGSMVSVLGLNTQWNRDADYAIVSNFFYAINEQKLSINVDNGIVSTINNSDIENLLSGSKDKKRATRDSILSGSDVYQLWLNVKDTNSKQEIDLSNGNKVCVHIKSNIETSSVIALVRNGMLIARHDKMLSRDMNNLRKNENFEPFSIVINVDDLDCNELFTLIKGAENPYHNQLEKGRLSPKDEKKLKSLFKELSENIQTHLHKKDRKGFDLFMPLLEIPNKAEAQGKSVNNSRPRSQTSKAKTNKSISKPPTIKVRPTEKGSKRPAPVIINRVLASKNAVRFKDNGDTITITMKIQPQEIDSKDVVYFSVSLAMDTDNNSTDSALDILKLSVNDKNVLTPKFIDIEKDEKTIQEPVYKTQIKLGRMSKDTIYNIVATVKKPSKVKNIGVALIPFLGLKQNKGDK
jgi:hypothetical protein